MREKFDITAIMFFAVAVVLMIFNCGPGFSGENVRFYEEFAKYQTQEVEEDDDEPEEGDGKDGRHVSSGDDLKSGVGKINPSTLGSDVTGVTDGTERLLQN